MNDLKPLSSEYYKRKWHLIRARALLMALLSASILLLLGISVAEGWVVSSLLMPGNTSFLIFTHMFSVGLFLAVFCVVLARMALHITYHVEHARVAQTGVTTLFLLVYVFILTQLQHPQQVVYLSVSKLFSIFLFFSFWQSQLSEVRMAYKLKPPPRIFIASWKAFFVCKWVLASCWLLSALGFALALVAVHPIVDLEGWEGIALLSTFFLLFRIFVRNPHAHT